MKTPLKFFFVVKNLVVIFWKIAQRGFVVNVVKVSTLWIMPKTVFVIDSRRCIARDEDECSFVFTYNKDNVTDTIQLVVQKDRSKLQKLCYHTGICKKKMA